jgi:catalase
MKSKFALALAAGFFSTLAVGALAEEPTLAEQVVAALNKVWGDHPGARANHAKGVVLEGVYAPSPAGKALSKAALFTAASMPVTVRFSDSSGAPNMPDGAPAANPHGMAVKFHLASGDDVDIVANSLPFFPVATGEGFRDLLLAIAGSPPGSPKPTEAGKFFAAHPAAIAAFGAVHTPSSFAREAYNGVDSFVFVAADGAKTTFRFRIFPEGGPDYLSPADAAKLAPNGLVDEIGKRVAAHEVKFTLQAQLAGPGDAVEDATKPYPADRKFVDLGTIILQKKAVEDKTLNFLPLNLVEGIEPSKDPLIQVRNDAYGISYGKRLQ